MAEIRRLTEEIEVEVHLARMEVRERWDALKPKVREIEQTGREAGRTLASKLATDLKLLRDEISDELHGAVGAW